MKEIQKKAGHFISFYLSYLFYYLLAFRSVIFEGRTFAKRDIFRYYHPVWKYAVDRLSHGDFPLWNPYNYFGTPFFANIQTCVLYPPILLLFLPDYTWAFNFYVIFHLALASVFCFLWMRDCGASRSASYLSGFAFGMSGYLMSVINLTISLCSVAYFPVVLLFFKRSLNTRGYFWKGFCGAALVFQYLSGDPAIFITTLIVLAVFAIFRMVQNRDLRGPALSLIQIGLTFAGLAAFQYPLFAEFLLQSNRAKASYDQVTMWSIQYNDLITIFIPFFSDISMFFMDYWVRQSWLEHYYSGISVLLLGMVAWSVRGKNLVGYHTLLAIFGIGLSLGRFSGIFYLFHKYFPFFGFVRYPARFFFLFSFAAACLAGFGFDQLLVWTRENSKSSKRSYGTALLMLLCALGLLYFSYHFETIRSGAVSFGNRHFADYIGGKPDRAMMDDLVFPFLSNLCRTLIIALMTLLALLSALFLKPKARYLAVFLGVLVFVDLYPTNIIEQCMPRSFLETKGGNPDIVRQDRTGIYRVMASPAVASNQVRPRGVNVTSAWQDLIDAFTPNQFLPDKIFDCLGYDSLMLENNRQIHMAFSHLENPRTGGLIDAVNVKYLASIKKDMGRRFKLVNETPLANLFVNRFCLPRAFFVAEARYAKKRSDILDEIIKKSYRPEQRLYLEEKPPAVSFGRSSLKDKAKNIVTILDYKPERIAMQVTSYDRSWLFFSDPYYPGWTARLDGKRIKIYRANYAFRAVVVPPGEHELVWTYEPWLFVAGVTVSVLTLCFLVFYYFRKKTDRPHVRI